MRFYPEGESRISYSYSYSYSRSYSYSYSFSYSYCYVKIMSRNLCQDYVKNNFVMSRLFQESYYSDSDSDSDSDSYSYSHSYSYPDFILRLDPETLFWEFTLRLYSGALFGDFILWLCPKFLSWNVYETELLEFEELLWMWIWIRTEIVHE